MSTIDNIAHIDIIVDGGVEISPNDLTTICFLCASDTQPRTARYTTLTEVILSWGDTSTAADFAKSVFDQKYHPNTVVIASKRSSETWGQALERVLGIIEDPYP